MLGRFALLLFVFCVVQFDFASLHSVWFAPCSTFCFVSFAALFSFVLSRILVASVYYVGLMLLERFAKSHSILVRFVLFCVIAFCSFALNGGLKDLQEVERLLKKVQRA